MELPPSNGDTVNLDDLTPAGSGSLAGPAAPPSREPVATFTQTRITHPDEIWSPRGSEITPPGRPLPGHGFEFEPVSRAERAAQHTAQDVGDYQAAAASVRVALRPGI